MSLTLISAVPRSRSAWVASWLARSGVRVLHDPARGVGSLSQYAERLLSPGSEPTIAVDTALPLLWPGLLRVLGSEVEVRVATLYRTPVQDSVESVVRAPNYRDLAARHTLSTAHFIVDGALRGNDLLRCHLSPQHVKMVHNWDSTELVNNPFRARSFWEWATGRPWDPEGWEQARSFRVVIDAPNMDCYPELAASLSAEVRPFWDKMSTYVKGSEEVKP